MIPTDYRKMIAAAIAAAVLLNVTSATASAAQQETASKAAPPAAKPERVYPVGYDDTDRLPDSKWRVHDIDRPQPPVVATGAFSLGAEPPRDAVVLFDGTDLSAWVSKVRVPTKGKGGAPPKVTFETREPGWKVEDGYVEATGPGSLVSKEAFGDCQIHLEWAAPAEVVNNSVGRGNSGILVMEQYEIQILDSHDNRAYADGQAGAIYGQYPPLVNASQKPGQWQSFDILFTAPKFDGQKLVEPAYATVLHNGVVIHNHVKLLGSVKHKYVASYSPHAPEEPILLQYHRNPVRFRNIWVRRLKGYDAP